jgi:iron complex outermembrane receptor protein
MNSQPERLRPVVAWRLFFPGGWVALALLFGGGPLRGQVVPALTAASELKHMPVEELLQQEIFSVSRRPESLAAAASNVFYLAADSDAATGATSLPELLRLAPNLFVAQASSWGWGIDARGFLRANASANKLLVLVDGRSVYSPLYSNVFWDSTDVFLPDMESIEVISGPAGSNWGANAVNGVINIQSKPATETVGGLAQFAGGTNGTQFALRQGWRLGRDAALRFYVKRNDRTSSYSGAGVDDDADAWHSTQAGFRADWGTPEAGAFTLQGDGFSGRFDTPGQPPLKDDGANLLLKWSRQLAPDTQLWVRAYYDYVKRDTSGALMETTHTADLEFQYEKSWDSGRKFLFGGNFRHIGDLADHSAPLFAILPAHLWYNVVSAFGQYETDLANRALRLTAGLRIEHNYFSGWEYQPSVRLAWRREKQTAWVALSRATRIPSRLETGFYFPAEPPYITAGGPDFTSEILRAYEIGWRTQLVPQAALTATVFYHDYDRLRSIETAQLPLVQANGVEGRSAGAELFLDYDVTPMWRLRFGGFYVDQDTRVMPGHTDASGGLGEESFPRYQLVLRSNFRLNRKTDLWLSLRHVDDVPASEDGGGVVPAYTELDANLRWRIRPDLEMSLTGRNLLQPSHPEIGGQNVRREIPRSVGVSIRYTY